MKKNQFLFDYQILIIMVSSMHHCHIARKYHLAIMNECVRLVMQSEAIYVLKTKALYKPANDLLYICY